MSPPTLQSASINAQRQLVVTYNAPDGVPYGGTVYLDNDARDTQLSGDPTYGQFMYCNNKSTCLGRWTLPTTSSTGSQTFTTPALDTQSFPVGTYYVQVETTNNDPYASTRQWEESNVVTVTVPALGSSGGSAGGGSSGGTGSTQADFTFTASPSALSVTAGSSVQLTLSWLAVGGYTWGGSLQTVGGGPSGMPSGATAGSPGGNGSAVWTISTSITTPAGSYPLTFTITDGKKTHTASVTLTVTTPVPTTTTSTPTQPPTPASPPATTPPATTPGSLPWPPLPDPKVELTSVSNGCGPGTASNLPRFLDTITIGSHVLNFRLACDVHDAGYSGARVADPINGGTIDTFAMTKAMVDEAFLANLQKICAKELSQPGDAAALKKCKSTVASAYYYGVANRVSDWLKAYRARPNLTGSWSGAGLTVFTMTQRGRIVTASWSKGDIFGEWRGIIISHDQDSVIKGYVHTTVKGVTKQSAFSANVDPDEPNQLLVNAAGGGLPGILARS